MGIRTDYICAAQNLIKRLAPYLRSCDFVEDFQNAVNEYNDIEHDSIKMNWGYSRIVFIGSNFVIKVDRKDSNDDFGTCDSEYKFYQYAKTHEHGHLFAPIHKFFYQSTYYYIMPFIADVGTGEDEVSAYLDTDDAIWVDNCLYDMHLYNFGFEDGYPVIIDYASVRDTVTLS